MRTHLYWNPWAVFDELERAVLDPRGSSGWPTFDIEDTDDETTLTADLPGMTEDELDIAVEAPFLTIRGERKARDGRYVARRRFAGAFERRFRLDDRYDLDGVKAHLAHGVLTLTLPKAAKAKRRRVKIATGMLDKVKGLLSGDKGDKDRAQAA